MRVGFFTECYRPIVNGVTASIDALLDGLAQAGVDVTTIAPSFPHHDDARDPAIVRLPSLPLPTVTGYRLCVPRVPSHARSRVRALELVHAHSPFVTGRMARAHARRFNVPLIFTYHTRIDEYAHYAPFAHAATRRAMVDLTRTFANAADAVIVPTRAMEERLRELEVAAPIFVVPSAIDVARFAAARRSSETRALLGARAGEPLALVVGRLGREKRIELALEALAHVPHARLAIVGAGPCREELERHARACGVAERVRFCGELPPAALPEVYAAADAFVFVSATETQGLVLAEALAAGLPVAAADEPVTREVLGEHGDLAPPEPAALGAALAGALRRGRDPDAAAPAAARFAREAQVRAVLAVYAAALARPRRSRVPYVWHTSRAFWTRTTPPGEPL